MAPDILNSTCEERFAYVNELYKCRGDCDSCGVCQVFRGQEPMIAYEDYINGKCSFQEISVRYHYGF